MYVWAYRVRTPLDTARAAFEHSMREAGFVRVEASSGPASVWTWLVEDGAGGTLITSTGFQRVDEVVAGLARVLRPASWASVTLQDRSVSAERFEVNANGECGPSEDLDETASEILDEWYDGAKYRSEAAEPLVAVLLDIDTDLEGGVRGAWHANAASVKAMPAPEPPPPKPPFRVFRHADGRRWQVRVVGERVELRLSTEDDDDWIERSRRFANPDSARHEAELLIDEQRRDGFLELVES